MVSYKLKTMVPVFTYFRPIQGPATPPAPLMTKWCLQQEENREGKEVKLGDESQEGGTEEKKRQGLETPARKPNAFANYVKENYKHHR